MSLALSTLIFEWRRYMAAVVALALSGMLVLVMLGLFTGIIHADFATTERSRADIFILPMKVVSMVNTNISMPARIQPQIFMNPHVVEVRSLEDAGGSFTNIPGPGGHQVQRFIDIWGVDPFPNAVTLPVDYTDTQRIALMEPGAIAVDSSALAGLGVKLGDKASINGHSVFVRTVLHNYQSLEQPTVVASRDTVRMLRRTPNPNGDTGPLMVRIDDPAKADLVAAQLNAISHGAWKAVTRKAFNRANENAVVGQQIIGVLLVFLTFMAMLIGVGITSQTLRGAILSNIREFASLRALGISMGSLRWIVIELSFWVGVAGILAALAITWLTTLAAGAAGLPLVIRPQPAAALCGLLALIAVASGAMAMGVLKHSQPADLLR
ncbi:MAG TPA: ABC transporter permease [Caulobacteraceae bacterium]|jgi:putative ABC transport system permease protein|nr:ABC transporter permease [Caulobacteraceae bacterium]